MDLYKNYNWKNVDFNSVNKQIPTEWDTTMIGKIIVPNAKSKMKALDGQKTGNYPFFNCSETQTKFSNDFQIEGENLFITTGGDYMFNLYFNGKASYSTDVWSVKIKDHNTQFINFFLKYNFDTNQGYFRGFKFKHLDKKGFQKMIIPIPQIAEQKEIVKILQQQQDIIFKTKNLISELEKRNEFMICELLSGNIRLKNENSLINFYKTENWKEIEINHKKTYIPSEWKVKKVSQLFNVFRGKVISKTFIQNNVGEYPVFSSATINNGCIGNINTYMFDGEYLTWNTDGYAGAVFYRNGKFNCTNVCGILEPINKISGLSSLRVLLMNEFKKFVRTGAHLTNKKLMSNVVENIEFIYPEKNEILLLSDFFDKIFQEVNHYEKILQEEEKKFTFLLEELMSGRLRVKV